MKQPFLLFDLNGQALYTSLEIQSDKGNQGILMGYLEDFREQIAKSDFQKFFRLWEEYCNGDTDPIELIKVLELIKGSDVAPMFGNYVETALPLWQSVQDERLSYEILRLLVDLQTTDNSLMADTATQALQSKYSTLPDYANFMRLVGLRARKSFQGAISHFELLLHMKEGNFVFHTSGWGTGEIVQVSPVREEVGVEFENVSGRKQLSFANAFRTLIPLKKDHFRVRRFAFADELEAEARKNPVDVIKLLLRDLGPMAAAEIKDEFADLVIPETEWTRWWQGARAKVKKDTQIEAPEGLKEPFRLREGTVSHEELFHKDVSKSSNVAEVLVTTYNFVRDLPDMLKKPEVKESLKEKLFALLQDPAISDSQILQVHIFLENHFGEKVAEKTIGEAFQNLTQIESIVNGMEIIAFKKRALVAIREHRKDWVELFLRFLFSVQPNQLRDYILKELNTDQSRPMLEKVIKNLLIHPTTHPDVFVWYFQKVVSDPSIPFSGKQGQCEFLENFLILFSIIEEQPAQRELLKKMYAILSGKRYLVVRNIIEGTTLDFIKEFLLLVAKCSSLSDHDKKIMQSLAEVAHPTLSQRKKPADEEVIWTTEAGYFKTKQRIQQLGTEEIVDNAREIEAARALGDLRENSEYKFALERRQRLQTELTSLSEQLNHARIITPEDIPTHEVGIGVKVDLTNPEGKTVSYSILGPWDTDADQNILSFQSKLAESMMGKKEGDLINFRGEELTITKLRSHLE